MSEYSSPVSGSLPRPPPLPPRRMPASTDKLAQCDVASQETVGVDRPEDDLSEQRLREVYDDEEIDRFLNLFSAYVTEVRLPELPTSGETSWGASGEEAYASEDPLEEGDWTPVRGHSDAVPSVPPPSEGCLSEEIALLYVIPLLPPALPPPPAFTLGRLRLTTQRLYLAIEPVYKPFFLRLGKLAIWEDTRQSSIYCAVFWTLWYHNLLLPALLLRTFYSLVRRKVLPYPTAAALRDHRREIRRANEFGDQIHARLSVSSAFGIKEAYRLFKLFSKANKAKAKNLAKESPKGKGIMQPKMDEKFEEAGESASVLDDTTDTKEEKDVKRTMLHCLNEVSDLHERIKNIFIWRRPAISRMYGTTIFVLFLVTLLMPAKYLAKFMYFVGGILFWHVTPILVALPPADRARLPAPFNDAPTDADYAMELISQRVAACLPVKPNRISKRAQDPRDATGQSDIGARDDGRVQSPADQGQGVDWKKWGARAAIGKGWAGEGKRLVTGGQWPSSIMPQQATSSVQLEAHAETHAFPAQHSTGPGLISLTPSTLFFTPMVAMTAKISVPLQDLRGVKKMGFLKGLSIRWSEMDESGSHVENEEKFRWVGSRDELFVRLIGTDGRRWMKV